MYNFFYTYIDFWCFFPYNGKKKEFFILMNKEFKQEKLAKKRRAYITKANDLIQKTRFDFSLTEQKIVAYALSKLNPNDTALSELVFEINEFFELCNVDNHHYQFIRDTLEKLKKKTFWITIDEQGTESCVSWFQKIRMNKRSGKVIIRFDDDLAPLVLQLKRRFTTYSILPILVMRSRYSVRLYEILKSYQNLNEWWFTIDDLRIKLNAVHYQRFNDLKVKVLDIAVNEINKYSDIDVSYTPLKDGRKYSRILFYISKKSDYCLDKVNREIEQELE